MRVLHVAASLSPEWGGPVSVIVSLTQALRQRGVESAVYATAGTRTGSDPVSLGDIEAQVFPTGAAARLWTGYAPALARALQDAGPRYDLIHIHELWHFPHFAAYRAAQRAGKPYVVTIQGALQRPSLTHRALRKRLYMAVVQHRILERAARLQATTEAEEQQIRAQGFTAPVSVIPNGVCPDTFGRLPSGAEFRSRLDGGSQKQIILFLGRIHPGKGLDLLAKAFADVSQERDDLRMVICGPDEQNYRSQVEALLRAAGALDKAVFTGMLTGHDKLEVLAAADMFVLPSYSEGFSMAVLEAMASQLPVVVSHECHFPEIGDRGAGFVVDTSVEQLKNAIRYLMDHPEERRRMGARGRELIMERYTWDAVAEQLERLYGEVLA